jgi:predicted dehydrogenase/nucleoside-diphosphate-sugar epimerase
MLNEGVGMQERQSMFTGSATEAHGSPARRPTAESPLRVVLLGAGLMARHHASAIGRMVETARVVGVADPSPDALAAMAEVVPGARLEGDPATLLESVEADVAHVCTPPEHHAAAARSALEAGLHVYVEKPFALDEAEAAEVLALAAERGLVMCAGHQLLFEAPSRRAREFLPALGRVVHLESYFAFRPSRAGRGGRPALSAEGQLIDILPHPVYLLLSFLEEAVPDAPLELDGVRVGRGGTVHALLRRGDVTGPLVVTLSGRPVESYLRVVGTNGSVHADFVRGTVQRAVGPGSSGIDKALAPYRLARQLLGGTTAALGRRILKRQRSYPGLVEIFEAFYGGIRGTGERPMTPDSILDTVRVCQRVAETLRAIDPSSSSSVPADGDRARVLVTGGTGFLGREILRQLSARSIPVRSISRRLPPRWDTLAGVDYLAADLAEGVPGGALEGIEAVIHCAAETAGDWDAHERNSTGATETLLHAAADAGVSRVVYISSLGILVGPDPLTEGSPLQDGKDAGPYVWGKAESERRARQLGQELGVRVAILRPGAIVDWRQLDPPGKLGRRLGNLFVAVGGGRDVLGIVDVGDTARAAAWMALHSESAPEVLNLVDPALPTKAQLVRRLRDCNPGLRVVWLPRGLLWPLSWVAIGLQKALRPGVPAINVAKVFAKRAFDTAVVSRAWPDIQEATSHSELASAMAAVPATADAADG